MQLVFLCMPGFGYYSVFINSPKKRIYTSRMFAVYLVLALLMIPNHPTVAQEMGDVRSVLKDSEKRKFLKHVRRNVQEKVIQCSLYGFYNIYESQKWVCTDIRRGGDCLVPGYDHPSCPTFCNAGYWESQRTTEELVRETLEDCS